jgi:hypothetical protein
MPGFIDNQTFQRWIALGAMSLCIVGAAAATPAGADTAIERRPTVQISVYNDAGLKRNTLRLAEENAATVFRHAGIDTEWKNCPAQEIFPQGRDAQLGASETRKLEVGESKPAKPCGQVAYPSRLVLRIINRPRGLVPEVFGVAYLSQDGHCAYCDVFVDPMVELQRLYPVSLDSILGHVAAHEIAHLLLGPNSHSPNGLMRAHWNSRTIDDLRRGLLDFNSTESSAMSNRLEFARDTDISADTAALVTMANPPPATFSPMPPQCPNSH